uniref:ankyrin repeat domain-containing protein 26 isoform X3 n=1 Tax=Callithrix jacchus TaxID=9483 RepID=UPI0023DD33DE|nr:ankyrin repeat domain-containing protein 26 isoform X3 [Callithrix jacchus]
METISGSRNQKGRGPSGFFTRWWRSSRGDVAKRDDSPFARRGYDIRGKHLGKLHRAASRGDVSRMQHILTRGNVDLDERDKKQRTALHLASANGHPKVVALLVNSGCQLNVFDDKNRTALVKDELTPSLLAVHEEKQEMVQFFIKRKENLTAVKFERHSIHQLMYEYKENKTAGNPQNSNPEETSNKMACLGGEAAGAKAEQVLAMISEEEQERLEESENNQLQISHWHKKEKDLLHENHMLQEEIDRLRLEIDTKEIRNQQKENKYLEDIEIVKAKNDFLQNALKQKEETLTTTISQYSVQLEVLTAENERLRSELEAKNQNQEALETEIESYHCRLAAAIQDCDQHQASKRDAELSFERAREEWLHLKEKLNFDTSNLNDKNEMLSKKLSNAENEIRSLKMKHRHIKDALREKTLVLEGIQNEEGKVNRHIQKQDPLEERLSQIQNENLLLQQQLDEAHKKADNQEKIINIQEQLIATVKNQAESKKQHLLLEQKNNMLVNKVNYLEERLYEYEKKKAERNETVRQLQQELDGIV